MEPGRGPYLDATVLGLGGLVLVIALGALTALAAFRQAPHRVAARSPAGPRGSALVRAGLAAGLPVAALAGLRFALEPGRGRTAVPVRSVMAAAVLAVTVGAATLAFGASLASQPAAKFTGYHKS